MENISYVGLSQQLALEQQMELTANNLANLSTPGYKSQNVLFIDYLSKPKGGEDINQVVNHGSYRDLSNGSFTQTHNPLDVAIEGNGYFSVQTPQGARYTKDGSFGLNQNREMVTKAGYPVMSEGGAPIVIPPEAKFITISKEGEVSSEQGQIARLKLSSFGNEQLLKNTGENLFSAGNANPLPAEDARVAQGFVEQSNVNPVLEMNKMIEILRMYQATQRMLQNDHDRIRNTIQKLTRV